MFGRKKKVVEENEWTIEYKRLWNKASAAAKEVRKQVCDVEAKIRVIELYPDCPEKEFAIERMNQSKQELAKRLAEYHKAFVAVEQYYVLYNLDIKVDWEPFQWKSGAELVEAQFRSIHNLWMRAN